MLDNDFYDYYSLTVIILQLRRDSWQKRIEEQASEIVYRMGEAHVPFVSVQLLKFYTNRSLMEVRQWFVNNVMPLLKIQSKHTYLQKGAVLMRQSFFSF